jgi:hypothetical protein
MIYRGSSNARPSRPVIALARRKRPEPPAGMRGPVIDTKYVMEPLDSLMEPDVDATITFDAIPDSPERRLRVTALATMAGVAVVTIVVAALLVFSTVHSVYTYFA